MVDNHAQLFRHRADELSRLIHDAVDAGPTTREEWGLIEDARQAVLACEDAIKTGRKYSFSGDILQFVEQITEGATDPQGTAPA